MRKDGHDDGDDGGHNSDADHGDGEEDSDGDCLGATDGDEGDHDGADDSPDGVDGKNDSDGNGLDSNDDGDDVTKIMMMTVMVSLVSVLLLTRRESLRFVSEGGDDSDSDGE